MSAFDDLYTRVAVPILLMAFGDTVTYFAAGSSPGSLLAPRSFPADVTRGGVVLDKDGNHLTQMESCTIFCPRDPAVGITRPGLGDALLIVGDANPAKWDFHSEPSSSDNALIAVMFIRKRLNAAGQKPAGL